MANIRRIESDIPKLTKRKRVAAYARVSKSTERLIHSVSAQVSYYNDLIQNNPEWEYAGVFADSGISGTGIKGRSEFQRMIAECDAGKIDIILTKSISRFGRNVVDLLETVRHLKEIGVEVRFEKENISSFSGDGEVMMSIIATIAQEEVRSTSENIKWGIRKRYKAGEDVARNKKVYGYRHNGEKYVIEEEEADIVRFIFQSTAKNVPPKDILSELKNRGVKTWLGYDFCFSNLYTMLRNEIYIGDRRMQKSYIADPIKQNKVKNRGELPQYYISDCHEPIIDKETFYKVQEILKQRVEAIPTYPFTAKIKCGVCGGNYTRRQVTLNGIKYVNWFCRKKKEKDITCTSVNYKESELEKAAAEIMGVETFDEDIFKERVSFMTSEINGDISFHMTNGEIKLWHKPQIVAKSKPEKKPPKHPFDRKIYCGLCGRRFGRSMSNTKESCLSWHCRTKSIAGETCDSVNYTDTELKGIFCKTMRKKEFDTEFFLAKVERMVIQKSGSVDIILKNGTIKHYEALKLRFNIHQTTSTDAFIEKITCAKCGETYQRQTFHDKKYVYWICRGKRKSGKTKCNNHDWADCNIRKVVAYLMGTEEFDEEKLVKEVEHIEAMADGSMKIKFKDGREAIWQKQ